MLIPNLEGIQAPGNKKYEGFQYFYKEHGSVLATNINNRTRSEEVIESLYTRQILVL